MRFDFYTPSEITMLLGTRLKEQRLRLNLTQNQLAEKAGMGKSTIIRIESGQGGTLENTIRVAIALGLINEFASLFAFEPSNIDEVMSEKKPRQRASGRVGNT